MRYQIFNKIVQLSMISLALCDGARILGIASFPSQSHVAVMSTLFKELAKKGHQMTVLTCLPLKEIPPNYTQITIGNAQESSDSSSNEFNLSSRGPLEMASFMWFLGNKLSEYTMKDQGTQTLLHSSNDQFDLIVMESFFNEALLGFSHKFNIPFVSVLVANEFVKDAVGDPFPYAYVPNVFLNYSDHMTFFQRIHNTLVNFMTKIGYHLLFEPSQDKIMRKYFSDVPNLPPLADIISNTSLLLANTHFSLDFPKPALPNLIEVGGMHIQKPKPLPQDIQKFLDEAMEGAIYFSMGSVLKSSKMSSFKQQAFLKAFAKLKQKILWKFEENLPNIPKNVKISKWFPQSDILAHRNIRVFISHGGSLSIQEAVYNSVPLIGIPIYADQTSNVFRAVIAGYALQLDFENITEESVYWTLNEVLHNHKYMRAAERVSRIFHDQPETPMERAVFWIEYVLRHNGAQHMRNAALDLTWYQYFLIDIIAVLIASCTTVVLLFIWLLRILVRCLLQKPQNSSIVIKKRN